MTDWLSLTWGSVCELRYGRALRGYKDDSGSTRIFGTNGPIGYSNVAPLATGPRPVVGRKGAYRGVHLAEGPFWVIDTAYWLEPRGNLDPVFAYYALLGVDINGMDSGSALPSLTRDHFYGVPLMLPPLEEQERIAGALRAFDDLIEMNRQVASGLGALTKCTYRAETDSLPKVPLSELLRLAYGKALPAKKRVPGPVPVVSSAGITGSHNEALVPGPGVVVGRKGTVGSVTWVRDDFYPIDTTFYATSDLAPEIVFETLTEANLSRLNSDSAVPGLNRDRALAQPVADARGGPARRLTPLLRAFRHTRDELLAEAAELSIQRDELLPLLMSGRVRVRDLKAVA